MCVRYLQWYVVVMFCFILLTALLPALQPEGQIGSIRGNVRKAAQAHVATHYGLTKGADERVSHLLKNNAYIYPVNAKVRTTLVLCSVIGLMPILVIYCRGILSA